MTPKAIPLLIFRQNLSLFLYGFVIIQEQKRFVTLEEVLECLLDRTLYSLLSICLKI